MCKAWFTYDIVAEDEHTSARAGVFHTPHGDVPTPIFMPVGTCGSVKGVHMHEVKDDVKAQEYLDMVLAWASISSSRMMG